VVEPHPCSDSLHCPVSESRSVACPAERDPSTPDTPEEQSGTGGNDPYNRYKYLYHTNLQDSRFIEVIVDQTGEAPVIKLHI